MLNVLESIVVNVDIHKTCNIKSCSTTSDNLLSLLRIKVKGYNPQPIIDFHKRIQDIKRFIFADLVF